MAKQLKLRRGTTTQHSTFTGASGEVTVDTTKKTLVVHDGVTAGGVPLVPVTDVSINGGNSKILRTDSAGNLGLGVTPSAWGTFKALQVGGGGFSMLGGTSGVPFGNLVFNAYFDGSAWRYINSAGATYYGQSTTGHAWFNAASGTAGNAISFTQAMTLDSSGNLLVGTTSTTQSHRIVGLTANAWAMQLQSSFATASQNYGVSIGFTAAAPNDSIREFLNCGDTGGTRMSVRSNGGIANYQANNSNLSDRREKTNFAPAGEYLAKICAIPVQTFNYIDQNLEEDDGLTLGVVAQDVQAVAPELVLESNWAGKDEEPKMRLSIYQTDLQYALMKCIQEQQAIITSLTERITALEQGGV
jgi:hypothetical protein